MATTTVSSGQTSSGAVEPGDTEIVYSGGTTTGTVVSGGGLEYVSSGGVADATSVLSGGEQDIFDGGLASGTIVSLGGSEILSSGGTTSDTVVSGGVQTVSAGGTANATIVTSATSHFAISGFPGGGFDIPIPGEQNVYGTANSSIVSGGQQQVFDGGTANSSTLLAQGQQNVSSGGTANFTTVSAGGYQAVSSGGTASGTIISQGGIQQINDGGVAGGATISDGGLQFVFSGGTANATIISSGGFQVLESGPGKPGTGTGVGGTANATIVSSGGVEVVDDGGQANSTTVSAGGFAFVSSGGTASALHVSSDGVAFIKGGGTASGTLIDSGGTVVDAPGGTLVDTTNGGTIISTGVAYVSAGQFAYAASTSGLSISGAPPLNFIEVLSGGTTSATTLDGAEEDVDAGGVASGTNLSNGGFQAVSSGGTAIGTNVSDGGTEIVSRGGAASGTIVSNGGQQYIVSGGLASGTMVSGGGVQYVYSGGSASGTIVSSGGTLDVHSGSVLDDTTVQDGGRLDLDDIGYDGSEVANVTSAGLLTVSSGGAQVYSQQLAGNYANRQFAVSRDKDDSTVLTEQAVCFAAGTLIRTIAGDELRDVRVEDLHVGDRVVTASGVHRPITWLGHRTIDCSRHPRPHEVHPVRIAAHAFGANRPARDLHVSPGHAICVDILGEVLIPASALVNGSTVRQEPVDSVTYWHVELDSHDVILAENMPAESYLDMGNRGFFAEGDVVTLDAAPDVTQAQRTHADFCRPFVDGGPLLDAVRLQLGRRAEKSLGWALTRDIEMHLEVDGCRIDPVIRGLTARFHIPAGARDVWLIAPTARPRAAMATADDRDLGLCLAAMRIDDGFASHDIALDDPLLCIGFHDVEDGCWRWTTGRARLPAALWADHADGFYLRLDLAGPPIPRWLAPAAAGQRPIRAA